MTILTYALGKRLFETEQLKLLTMRIIREVLWEKEQSF